MTTTVLHYINKFGKKGVGFLLFIICSIAIYTKVLSHENWAVYGSQIRTQLALIPFYNWVVLLALMGCNFLIESVKWKQLIQENNTISLAKAAQSVFVGQAFAFFTPNRVGEYVGRTLFLDKGNKAQGVAQMAWTSYAQLLVTVLIGTVALFWNLPFFPWLKWVTPVLSVFAIFLFFYRKQFVGRAAFLNRIQIPTKAKVNLLLLSFLRYFVFTIQYLWAAQMLGMDIPVLGLVSSVAVLFICLTILPTISITELIVRGQLLLLILAPWYGNQIMVISLSSLIWVVNFLLPAIIGTLLLLGFRLKQ